MKNNMSSFNKLQFLEEEGRQHIYEISEMRRINYTGYRRTITKVKLFAFDRSLLKSFVHNVNIMVIVQMALAAILTFACEYADIYFQVHPTLFVSPLVFPLAFSINADFQRRERVLQDLAEFKASSMMWFFCMRDWYKDAGLDETFMKTVSNKVTGLIIHLREYLLTAKEKHRDFVTKVLYEDFSDIAQLTDDMRKHLPTSPPLIARVLHNLGSMCVCFERLRVVREYRSPRSIRSFTKIFIFILPILLSPYYVYLGRESKNKYSPYVVAIIVSFLFGCLQGVQDKLDDPFDGMSEDDINLSQLDDWTLQSLEATANRTFKIGRFTVSAPEKKVDRAESLRFTDSINPTKLDGLPPAWAHRASVTRSSTMVRPPWQRQHAIYSDDDTSTADDFELHPYADVLSNLPGNATILRGGHVKPRQFTRADLSDSQSTLDKLDNQEGDYSTSTLNAGNNQVTFSNPVFSTVNEEDITVEEETPLNAIPSSSRRVGICKASPGLNDPSGSVFFNDDALKTIKPVRPSEDLSVTLPRGLQSLFAPPTPPTTRRQSNHAPPLQKQRSDSGGSRKKLKVEAVKSSSSNEEAPLLKTSPIPPVFQPEGTEGLALANVGVASYIRRESMSGKSGLRRLSSSSPRTSKSDIQSSGDDEDDRNRPKLPDPNPINGRPRFTIGRVTPKAEHRSERLKLQRSISESSEMSERLRRNDTNGIADESFTSNDHSSTSDLLSRDTPYQQYGHYPTATTKVSLRRGKRQTGSDPDVTLKSGRNREPSISLKEGDSYA